MTVTTNEPRNFRRQVFESIPVAGYCCFVIYYGTAAFWVSWVGDFHVHHSVVQELYRNLWHPFHHALPVAGHYTANVSPYLLVVAFVGKVLGVSAYQALQIAGIANIFLYVVALKLFFWTMSPGLNSNWPTFLFLLVSLFMRAQHFNWSSETDYLTMQTIQAYPSMAGWTLAVLTFVVTEHIIQGRRRGIFIDSH